MSEPKNKKKKPDLLVTILSIALIAFVIVFIIMAVQYYKLTNSLMEVRQIQQTEQVGMETGESETSTEDVVSGVDTEENTKKETKEETIRTTENGTEKQTVTETVAESGSETESLFDPSVELVVGFLRSRLPYSFATRLLLRFKFCLICKRIFLIYYHMLSCYN